MLKRIKRAALPIGVLLASIGVLVLINATKPEPDVAATPPRPLSVYTETAQVGAVQLRVDTHGEVRATVSSDIVAQVAGRVMAVSPEFIEGGKFAPGEALVTIDDTDYRAALNEAQARLAAAKVDLEQALADADVARKQLAGTKNPSPLALKKPQVARARAAIEAAEANVSLANTNLARTRISMPYEGRVASTTVDLGQFVSPGRVLGATFATESVEVRLPITDRQLGALGVPIGYTAGPNGGLSVDLGAEVAGQYRRWRGVIQRIDAAIDPSTRVVYATATVNDPYSSGAAEGNMPLAVGLFVDAAISGRTVSNAIQIPNAALRAGNRVFVLTGEGQLAIRDVELIYQNSSQAILASGVTAGEQVIVSAIRNPIPGMRLEAIGSPSGAAGGNEPFAAD
jgi:RND family efflux transporter MFP subunit